MSFLCCDLFPYLRETLDLVWYENFCSGEKATAENIADAIAENRAELVHLPSSVDLNLPLPSKECPSCNGSVRTFNYTSTNIRLVFLVSLLS